MMIHDQQSQQQKKRPTFRAVLFLLLLSLVLGMLQKSMSIEFGSDSVTKLVAVDSVLISSSGRRATVEQGILPRPRRGGAFLHVGKTGGSTLSLLLRNGCHSFVPVCRRSNITDESMASKLIKSYFHIPDFFRGTLRTTRFDFYLVTIRDPLDRTISAFVFDHIKNRQSRNETVARTKKMRQKYAEAWKCFPSLESFVNYIDDLNFTYPYRPAIVNTDSCQDLAKAALAGRVNIFSHFCWNLRRIKAEIPNHQTIYVNRQEHLWNDWREINRILGQVEPVIVPNTNTRNSTVLKLQDKLPVAKELSQNGTRILCRALQSEYEAYIWFLKQARNLNETDVADSIKRARQQCPNLNL
jgi:hypothetical protein